MLELRLGVVVRLFPLGRIVPLGLWRWVEVVPRAVGLRDLLARALLDPAKLLLQQRALGPVDLLRGRNLGEVILRPLGHPSHLLLHQLVRGLAPALGEDVRVGQRVDQRVVPPRGLLLRAVQQHGLSAHVGRSLHLAVQAAGLIVKEGRV